MSLPYAMLCLQKGGQFILLFLKTPKNFRSKVIMSEIGLTNPNNASDKEISEFLLLLKIVC